MSMRNKNEKGKSSKMMRNKNEKGKSSKMMRELEKNLKKMREEDKRLKITIELKISQYNNDNRK
jgi:GH18 family chitinase